LDAVPSTAPDFAPLVAAAGGTIDVVDIEDPPVPIRVELDPATPTELSVSVAQRRLDRSWRAWSFSGMKSAAEATNVSSGAGGHADDHAVPVRGGADEVSDVTDAAEQPPVPDAHEPALLPGLDPSGLATAPGGTEFGTMVHAIFEQCDFASPTLRDDLVEACTQRLRFRSFAIDPAPLADGLLHAIESPLGGPLGAARLRDLGRAHRLDELAFDMVLGSLRASQVGGVLAEHLPSDDLLRPWAVEVARAGFDVPVAGMLNGSIDLVARADGHRYWLADYKTNQLGIDSAYTRREMADAMAHHHYVLQASIYLVALHRYLRWRLPGYRPEDNLLGAAYLFVRGMDPSRDPHDARGVYWWQPPPTAIVALDRLFAGEVAA
jgi:exodeoxyribonuclease V beta subunit